MDAKLIYLSFIFFAACLVSSCASDASEILSDDKGAEVTFTVSDQSRANSTTTFREFAVYGDMKFSANNSSTPTVIFNNTKVVNTGGVWSYEGTQYWFPQHEHSFVAVTPVSLLASDNDPLYSNSTLSFTYTMPTSGGVLDTKDITDIIAATHRRLYHTTDISTTTIFRFSHLMSKIDIAPAFNDNMMADDEYILVHKLEISGVDTKALFTLLPAPLLSGRQTDDMSVSVTGQENDKFTIGFKTPVKVENNAKNVSLFADDDALILIPQTFAADSEAKLTLYYSTNEDSSITDVTLPLNNQRWEPGRSYTYKFIIERIGLELVDCEINPWNVIRGDDITVD